MESPKKQHKNPWVIEKLEQYFFWHGQIVSRKPWLASLVCLLVCGLLAVGLIRYTPEVNPYKLWIPTTSDFVRNTNWLWKNFPPDTRFHSIVITADNVLRPDVLMHVLAVHKVISNVIGPQSQTWESSCFKIPVVDLRGDDVGQVIDDSDEDVLSFGTPEEESTSTSDFDIYDYLSAYDTNDGSNRKRRKRSIFGESDPSVELYPEDYCDIVNDVTQPTCLEMGILELWAQKGYLSNEALEAVHNTTQQDIIDVINTKRFSEVFLFDKDFTSFLGGVERNSSGQIIGAKATTIHFYGKIDLDAITDADRKSNSFGAPVDKGTLEFEAALLNELLEFTRTKNAEDNDIKTYVNVARSFDDLANESIGSDVPRIIGGVMIVYTYVLIMLGSFDCVGQKPFLGGIGLLCVFLSIIASYGISSAIGLVFSPMHNIIPFLLMGIGIDDMFVIVQSHMNLEQKDPSWKTKPIDQLVGETLKHAGVAITITSITDLVVFLIGASTVLPALRSFCIFCAFGVTFVYIMQAVFFTAFLSLDIKRVRENRNGFFPCISHRMKGEDEQDDKKKEAWWRKNPGKIFFKKYATVLMKPASKAIVLLLTFLMLGVGIYGVYELRQEFNPAWFLPPGSYLLGWLDQVNEYFPGSGEQVTINIGEIDYANELWKVEALVEDIKNQSDIVTNVDSWLGEFRSYVESNKLIQDVLDAHNLSDADFFYRLTQFLYSSSGAKYRKNFHFESSLQCGLESPHIQLSTIEFSHKIFSGPSEHLPAMNRIKKLVNSYNFSSTAFAVGKNYAGWETDEIIQFELYQNVGLSLLCVFVVAAMLLVNIKSCVMVFLCVFMTLVNVGGYMHFWGLTIDVTSCVTLVIAVGLCIDQAAHIAHTFLVTHIADKNQRAIETLCEIGPPVMNGGVSTFLAFVITASSESHVFLTFFKIFTLVIVFGLFHGLVFLPVVLSLLPDGQKVATTVDEEQPKLQSMKSIEHKLENGTYNNEGFTSEKQSTS